MKKYRLKEEVKKYCVASHRNKVITHDEWSQKGFNKEALEEVDERIEVKYDSNYKYITKYSHVSFKKWTEQEREDIEKFLNVFDSWERMNKATHEWFMFQHNREIMSFTDFLKERGYDK